MGYGQERWSTTDDEGYADGRRYLRTDVAKLERVRLLLTDVLPRQTTTHGSTDCPTPMHTHGETEAHTHTHTRQGGSYTHTHTRQGGSHTHTHTRQGGSSTQSHRRRARARMRKSEIRTPQTSGADQGVQGGVDSDSKGCVPKRLQIIVPCPIEATRYAR